MRRFLPFLFFIGLALCQPQYNALSLDTPPKIDGDLSEYQGKTFIFLPYGSIPDALWRGPQDAEAKVWLCWDKDNLYIAGEVWDDFLAQKGEPWQESIQFCLAPDLEITYSSMQNKLFVFKNGAPLEPSFPFAVKSNNASYQIELAIPWTLLGITPSAPTEEKPEQEKAAEGGKTAEGEKAPSGVSAPAKTVGLEGLTLKFNAVLYDTDLNGYRGYLSWAEVKDWKEGMGIVRDTKQFGDVILSTQPSAMSQISFLFAPSPLYIGDEEVDITPWLLFNRDFKGKFKFTLKRGEETLLEKEEDVERPAGFSSFPIHWDARGKPEGTYIAQAELAIEGLEAPEKASLVINKLDSQKLISSLQEEIDIMGRALKSAKRTGNWQDAVLFLQGEAWLSMASPFLDLLNQKIKETNQPDPDARTLAKIFLWNSREDVAMYKGSSALIRRDFQSPAIQPFATLKLPYSKELSYVWDWRRWGEGSYERLGIFFANLPIASVALWSHPNPQNLSLQRDSILGDWRKSSISPQQIGGSNWQGWLAISPQGGARAMAQQGANLWLVEALNRDACLFLLNSALSGQPISKIDSFLPPLQPDVLVEDVGKTINFNFQNACFFSAKDDSESLALAQALSEKLGGKLARLEEVNRYKDIVIVGSTALHQLVSGFKLPTPERKAYILSRYLWGKNVLILVGKEPGGTRYAVDVLKDLIDYLRDKRMLVGDIQTFSNLHSGNLSPQQVCLSAMGALCDFVGVADKGTKETARDALWLSADKGWELTVIPGETFSSPEGDILSLGGVESVQASQDAGELLSSIHKAGGLAVLGMNNEGLRSLPFDAWLMGKVGGGWAGKPFVAGTEGEFAEPLRTIVFSNGKGIYDILSAIRKGDCLAFSPYQSLGNEKIREVINILLDEKAYLMGMFSRSVEEKASF